MNKLYAERDIEAQGNFYTRHVSAMTSEDLHRKSDIAAELAHRDIHIEVLWREVKELRAANRDLQLWFDDARATAEGAQAPGSGKTCRCIGPGNGCCCEKCDDTQSQPPEPQGDRWINEAEPFWVRGFQGFKASDFYGHEFSIQKSSLATEDCIWFGVNDADPEVLHGDAKKLGVVTDATCGWVKFPIPDEVLLHTRMHLSRDQVKSIIPVLQCFVDTGELPKPPVEQEGKGDE